MSEWLIELVDEWIYDCGLLSIMGAEGMMGFEAHIFSLKTHTASTIGARAPTTVLLTFPYLIATIVCSLLASSRFLRQSLLLHRWLMLTRQQ